MHLLETAAYNASGAKFYQAAYCRVAIQPISVHEEDLPSWGSRTLPWWRW